MASAALAATMERACGMEGSGKTPSLSPRSNPSDFKRLASDVTARHVSAQVMRRFPCTIASLLGKRAAQAASGEARRPFVCFWCSFTIVSLRQYDHEFFRLE